MVPLFRGAMVHKKNLTGDGYPTKKVVVSG
jgi:hypothetical protein